MGSVIGDVLPVAVGIAALSLLPMIVVILMLFGERARSTSLGFLFGWLLGMAAVMVIIVVAVDSAEEAAGGDRTTVAGIAYVVLGGLLLFLAYRSWRKRPKLGEEPVMPKWMSSISSMTAGKALGLGALLAGANPKNLAFTLSAGVAMASAGLSTAEIVVVLLVFVIIASVSVASPVIFYLVLGERAIPTLNGWKEWLTHNNATVLMLLFLVFGAVLVARGLGALT